MHIKVRFHAFVILPDGVFVTWFTSESHLIGDHMLVVITSLDLYGTDDVM